MKKTITITLIVIFLINLISIPSFAEEPDYVITTTVQTAQQDGTVEIENSDGKKTTTGITGQTYTQASTTINVATVLSAIPQFFNLVMNKFVETTSTDEDLKRFTIYDTVMGHYDIFNLNYTDIPKNAGESKNLFQFITTHVLKFYNYTRNLSIAISLLVLVYIGIRMAVSTVSSDQAKYKKMLISWVSSIILVFALHLLIITISFVLQKGFELVDSVAKAWKIAGFEEQIYKGAIENLTGGNMGYNIFTTVVIIYIFTWYQAKFFLYYLHRTIEVNFLVVVAPLVTITYSIDKIGDSKAQAFGNFIKEISVKSAIQLIHAVLYVVFIATAGAIAVSQPILALIFFAALSRAEKIAKKIFDIKDKGMAETEIPFV